MPPVFSVELELDEEFELELELESEELLPELSSFDVTEPLVIDVKERPILFICK